MSRISKLVTSAAFILLLAACTNGRDKLVVGQDYEGHIFPYGLEQVPLPEGSWSLVAWHDGGGVMIQTREHKISGMIEFDKRKGPLYAFCGRRDILHMGKSFTGSALWGYSTRDNTKQDCWGIDHWPAAFHGQIPEHMLRLRDYIETQDLELPSTMIVASFRKTGGRGRSTSHFLSVDYYFNPELEGFAPSRELSWRSSEWHRDRAFRDPKKKAYVEKLIKWAESWDERVNRGFDGLLKRGGT